MHQLKLHFTVMCALLMLFGCTHDIYPVKAFKYYDESAVDVEVIINNEETQHILCAFAPNTDFSRLKKVAIGSIKSEDLVQGTVYYCQIAQ